MAKRRVSTRKGQPTRAVRFRRGLEELNGAFTRFRANVGRASMTSWKTNGVRLETLELRDVFSWNEPDRKIADHVWVKLDDIENRDVIEKLLALDTPNVKRIVFNGIVYPYAEPMGGKGFHSFRGFHYSIGSIEVLETKPDVMTAVSKTEEEFLEAVG